ncbi:hypothetical protein H8356DRAFT_202912 [Neocallimastix lanati (nom. inval.)]|uniref:Uncharacterized protein n=1 Tax=Neocallimastix californiae TaxID=1754190 RepID=A0A1Y2AU67_9FUNG|nr:hypothetical protein H8356DRAFT_202912 [Neocallimastix sp. JGI-2020a]ORY26099.1 hypothetical protein LY90DRAFT_104930 [Neocallimastix californiae]|eukprot:ORY26099.1 hypothetical protein LY90DRAFT_104930 [Neocallimastix californiae]
MNEYNPKPPKSSNTYHSKNGMIKHRKYKANIDNFYGSSNRQEKYGKSKSFYDVEDLLKKNIDLKKKINKLIRERNKLITEARSSEENRIRYEKKCHDLIKITSDVKKYNNINKIEYLQLYLIMQ